MIAVVARHPHLGLPASRDDAKGSEFVEIPLEKFQSEKDAMLLKMRDSHRVGIDTILIQPTASTVPAWERGDA